MGYVLLAECLLLLLMVTYFLCDGDLFSPACLFVLVFILVSFLSFVGMNTWNDYDLSFSTGLLLFGGCLFFVLGSVLLERRQSKKWEEKEYADKRISFANKLLGIRIKPWKLVVLITFIAIAAYIKIGEIQSIGGTDGGSLSDAISYTRYETSNIFNETSNDSEGFSTLVRQCDKIVNAIAFSVSFLLVIYFKTSKRHCERILIVVCFVAAVFYSLLSGSRGGALGIIISLLFAKSLLDVRLGKSRRTYSKRLFAVCVVVVAALLPIFYVSLPLLGREEANSEFVEYISFYFGCGLPSLESVVTGNTMSADAGEYAFINSFRGLYSALYKLGFVSYLPALGDNWVFLGGHASNVYTCFYRYYVDLGILGVAILSFLAGMAYTAIYHLAINSLSVWVVPLWLSMARTLIDVGRDDTLFATQLSSLGFYNTIVYMVVITCFLFEGYALECGLCFPLGRRLKKRGESEKRGAEEKGYAGSHSLDLLKSQEGEARGFTTGYGQGASS